METKEPEVRCKECEWQGLNEDAIEVFHKTSDYIICPECRSENLEDL